MVHRLTNCPICTSQNVAKKYHRWDHDIVKCGQCGVGFVEVAADLKPEEYYSSGYFEGEYPDGYGGYAASEKILRNEFASTIRFLEAQNINQGRLLDVGCAYGYFLLEAAKNFDCKGLDISHDAVNACRARGIDAVQGNADHETLGTERYDVVTLFDCIEHLQHPAQTINTLSDHVRAGGTILLTTGDWGSLLARLMGRHWRLMTPPQHLFYFTRKSMESLLEAGGFRIRKIDRPWKRVPLSLVAYQILRRMRIGEKAPAFLDRFALPINLFDTMRVLAEKV